MRLLYTMLFALITAQPAMMSMEGYGIEAENREMINDDDGSSVSSSLPSHGDWETSEEDISDQDMPSDQSNLISRRCTI